MLAISASTLPPETLGKITNNSLRDNVKEGVLLMQGCFHELRRLPTGSKDSILKAHSVAQKARLIEKMVYSQILDETKKTDGEIPLTKAEIGLFEAYMHKTHIELLRAQERLSPVFFSEQIDILFSEIDSLSEPNINSLTVAFIRGVRLARAEFEKNPLERVGVGDVMGCYSIYATILMNEDVFAVDSEDLQMRSIIADLRYAVMLYLEALKVMRENSLEYAGQGVGFDVAIHHKETPIMLDIKIPIMPKAGISPARASSMLNSVIASSDMPIGDNVHISFKRGAE